MYINDKKYVDIVDFPIMNIRYNFSVFDKTIAEIIEDAEVNKLYNRCSYETYELITDYIDTTFSNIKNNYQHIERRNKLISMKSNKITIQYKTRREEARKVKKTLSNAINLS